MTQTRAPAAAGAVRWLPGLVLAAAGGLATGGFAAWAYYADFFRPWAHSFGLWIVLVALLGARRAVPEAVARSVCALAAAVVAFYVGKKVMYGIDYPGMPYAVNAHDLVVWLGLALVAGTLFGWVFCHLGRDSRSGSVAAAAAIGLLVADAVRRGWGHVDDAPAMAVLAVVGTALVLAVSVRSVRQLAGVALWVVPLTLLGLVLVSLPDVLEQLLVTGAP